MTAKQTGLRGKVREGTVVSDKMQKTVVVAIQQQFRHRLYKKSVRRVRRLMAHDEHEEAKLGDRVRIAEASPVSRRKRWRLLEVLVKADLPEVAPESIDLELLGEVKAEEPETEAPAEAAAPAEEPVPEEAISSPETEAVVPEEVEVAEEVPEIEDAAGAESEEAVASDEAETTSEAESEPEAEVEEAAEAEPAAEETEEEAAASPDAAESADEEKGS
jgi:small subunit ribosomal protein S17